MWPFATKCWCGSGFEQKFCSHRGAQLGRETRLEKAVRTGTNPTVKRHGKRR